MKLGFGIQFNDLYDRAGLLRVDAAFREFLAGVDAALAERLAAARSRPPAAKEESDLLIALAPHVEDFLGRLFGIETEARALAGKHNELAPLYSVKRLFVQRRALHKVKPEALQNFNPSETAGQLFGGDFTELDFARRVTEWQQIVLIGRDVIERILHRGNIALVV
jgi:hypothetical protein